MLTPKNGHNPKSKFYTNEQFLVVVFLIIICIASVLALRAIKQRTQEDVGYALETVLNTTHQGIHYWIENRKNDIEEFSKHPHFIKLTKRLLDQPEEREALISAPIQQEIRDFFKPVLEAKKYEGIFIISKNNISLASMRDLNLGDKNLIASDHPELLTKTFDGEFVFIPPIVTDLAMKDNDYKHMLTMFIAAPIIDENGEVLAVLTFRLDPRSDFSRVTQLGRIGKSGETYAIDRLGYMISASRFNDQLVDIGLIENIDFDYHIKVSDPGGNLLKGYVPNQSNTNLPLTIMAKNTTKLIDSTCTSAYRDYRGVEVMGAWLWDEELGIGLTTEIDEAEALSQYYLKRNILIILIALIALVAGVLTRILIITRNRNEIELIKLNEDLEDRVKLRTAMLEQSNTDLSDEIDEHQKTHQQLVDKNTKLENTIDQLQQTQSQLIQSEKMASLGNLIAGIAHEINTPIGAIKASLGNLENSINLAIEYYLKREDILDDKRRQLIKTLYIKSRKSKHELSSREKRQRKKEILKKLEENQIENASIIADTLVYMGVYEKCDEILPMIKEVNDIDIFEKAKTLTSLYKNKSTIGLAADKAAKTIFALKKFSHKGVEDDMEDVDINDGIDTILTIYHNQMKVGIEVIRNYENIPKILGRADEITQIWTNLIHNAIQAMNHNGTLEIRTWLDADHVNVSVQDTGKGIPEEIKDKIFDPFFTTKPAGEGTGIGLDIVNKIVEDHKGKIHFESVLGKGTTFYVSFPISPNPDKTE